MMYKREEIHRARSERVPGTRALGPLLIQECVHPPRSSQTLYYGCFYGSFIM